MVCAVITYKCTETHKHTCILFFLFAYLSPSSHTYKPTCTQTHTCTCARAHTHHNAQSHQIQTCLLVLWADILQLQWQAKQVWAAFIHFSLHLAWGFRHGRQSQQGGDHIPFTVAPALEKQCSIQTAGQQKLMSFGANILSTLCIEWKVQLLHEEKNPEPQISKCFQTQEGTHSYKWLEKCFIAKN